LNIAKESINILYKIIQDILGYNYKYKNYEIFEIWIMILALKFWKILIKKIMLLLNLGI